MFRKGDIVHYADDLLQTPRLVTEVSIDKSGAVWYGIGYSEEEQVARKRQEELDRREYEAQRRWYTSFSMPTRNRKRRDEIALIARPPTHEEQSGVPVYDPLLDY